MVALAREPDVPLYKTEALVVASELAIRVDGLPPDRSRYLQWWDGRSSGCELCRYGHFPGRFDSGHSEHHPVENTPVLEIDAIHPDPELAALYANAAGRALAEELNRVGPGLGSFALQVEAPVKLLPLEVSRLPNIVFSVRGGGLCLLPDW